MINYLNRISARIPNVCFWGKSMRYDELSSQFKEKAKKLERDFVEQALAEMHVEEREAVIEEMISERLANELYDIEKDEFGKFNLVRLY